MVSNTAQIPTPPGHPQQRRRLHRAGAGGAGSRTATSSSADFSGTFPDYFQKGANPKFDFGAVSLVVADASAQRHDRAGELRGHGGRRRQGLDLRFRHLVESGRPAGVAAIRTPIFTLVHALHRHGAWRRPTTISSRTSRRIYAEQYGPGTDVPEPGHQGARDGLGLPPRPGARRRRTLPADHRLAVPLHPHSVARRRRRPSPRTSSPDSRIEVDTSQPGNFLFTFSINGGRIRLRRVSAAELRHLHEPAVHHERAVDQPAHPAQRRGLQQVLRGPGRQGTGGQRPAHVRRGLPRRCCGRITCSIRR